MIEQVVDFSSRFSGIRIGVLGDVMLDRYLRGRAARLSPEAPVPVVEIIEEKEHPGGAANVATNLAGLGCVPVLMGIVGSDSAAQSLSNSLANAEIDPSLLVSDPNRLTTVKTRVIANGQHIVRADRENTRGASSHAEARLLNQLSSTIASLDAIVLQDYNKGTLSPAVIDEAIKVALRAKIPILVDPKVDHFFQYKGTTLFKPNRAESEMALGSPINSIEDAVQAAETILSRTDSEHVVVTLGEEGMVLVSRGQEALVIPTTALEVADVSGAGDTVIATLAAGLASQLGVVSSVHLANVAAGVVCGHVGTVPIQLADLQEKSGLIPTVATANSHTDG